MHMETKSKCRSRMTVQAIRFSQKVLFSLISVIYINNWWVILKETKKSCVVRRRWLNLYPRILRVSKSLYSDTLVCTARPDTKQTGQSHYNFLPMLKVV